MSEAITNAGAAGTDGATVVQVSPDQLKVPTPEERIARAAALIPGIPGEAPAPEPKQEAPKAFSATPPKQDAPALADIIRSQREARQAAQAEAQKRSTLEQELHATRAELARARADREAFEEDPVGYAKARKWTQEQQLLYGQSLLYDLAPDKADPEFRIRMFEVKQKRKEAEQAKEAETAAVRAQQEAAQRQVQDFYQDTVAAVRTFDAGSFPESEAWFGEDVDTYVQSLMATARNVAARANQEGRVADLSPAALARTLEAETARRLAARDSRKQARQAPRAQAVAAQPAGGTQSADTMSTRNMTGSGSPRPPATDERERIRRAAEVAFKTR